MYAAYLPINRFSSSRKIRNRTLHSFLLAGSCAYTLIIAFWLLAGKRSAAPRSSVLWRETLPGWYPESFVLRGALADSFASLSTSFEMAVDFPALHVISRITRILDLTER